MLVEQVELTLGLVDLGPLDEFALMTIFGSAHAHHLTRGTGGTLRDVVDAQGTALYGGYYWTHLSVPPSRRLSTYQVWDHVDVGVDVAMFGSLLLSSTYALGRRGELSTSDVSRWDLARLPSMRAGNTFYPDVAGGEFRAAAPRAGALAPQARLTAPPEALARFRATRDRGFSPPIAGSRRDDCGRYALVAGRDLRAGHGVMFARWVQIADAMEQDLLRNRLRPALPSELTTRLSVVDRETCYVAGRRDERVLQGTIDYAWTLLTDSAPEEAEIAVAELRSDVVIHDDAEVLLRARVKKHLVIPRADPSAVAVARGIIASHVG